MFCWKACSWSETSWSDARARIELVGGREEESLQGLRVLGAVLVRVEALGALARGQVVAAQAEVLDGGGDLGAVLALGDRHVHLAAGAGQAVDRRAVAHVVREDVAARQDVSGLAGQLQAPLEERPVRDDIVLGQQIGDVAGAGSLRHGDDRLARPVAGSNGGGWKKAIRNQATQRADEHQRQGEDAPAPVGPALLGPAEDAASGRAGLVAVRGRNGRGSGERRGAGASAAPRLGVAARASGSPLLSGVPGLGSARSFGALARAQAPSTASVALGSSGISAGSGALRDLLRRRLALAPPALALEGCRIVSAELVGRGLHPVAVARR